MKAPGAFLRPIPRAGRHFSVSRGPIRDDSGPSEHPSVTHFG
jgi:hypothetical protein